MTGVRRGLRRALALAALCAAVMALAPALAVAQAGTTSAQTMTEDAPLRLLARVNRYRADRDLAPLVLDARLAAAAQAHAEDMAAGDFFSHRGSDGGTVRERLARAGYRFRVAAENLAGGTSMPEAVADGWMASPGHRRNLLLPEAREAGVGHAFVARDKGRVRLRHYWTLVLGAPYAASSGRARSIISSNANPGGRVP